MSRDGDGRSDAELLGETIQAIANPHRIHLLLGFAHGESRAALVDQLPISESGVTNHLRTLADAGLLYRTEDGWHVSPLGRFFADCLDDHMDVVAEARRRITAAHAAAEDEYADIPLPEQERTRTVEWRAWEHARSDLEALLEGAGMEDETEDR